MSTETVFFVPRLMSASVVAGSCCPVPVEAIIIPELEALAGVESVEVDWQSGRVTVQHTSAIAAIAAELDDLGYPAQKWNTATAGQVVSVD